MRKPISVKCDAPDRHGRRRVFTTYDCKVHTDHIDTDSSFQRQKSREAAKQFLKIPTQWTPDCGDNDTALFTEMEEQLIAAADAGDQHGINGADNPFLDRVDCFTLAELEAEFPKLHPSVVHGLLRQGETCNIISVPKVGKSWLVYNLALSIITGNRWLGRFETSPGQVLLIDNELHRETLAHRIPMVGDAMGLFRTDYASQLDIWPLRGNCKSLSELAGDFQAIDPGKYQAIILDAKYRFAEPGTSENDNAAEARFYNQLDQYAAHTGDAFVLVHHASKGQQSDKRVTDVGAGAGAQSRAADCHLVLREHEEEGVVVLDAAVRSFAPVKPQSLRWDFPLWKQDLFADPVKLKGKLTQNQQRQSELDHEGTHKILKALKQGPATSRQLRKFTGMGRERQQRLLDKLTADKQLNAETTTVKGNECDLYSLPK